GARVLVRPDGTTEGSLGDADADEDARAASLEALAAERSSVREVAGHRSFVEVLEPPLRLVVCGAGHDVIPVVRAGAALGWNVVVADDRPAFLTRQRFPEASGFVALERPDRLAADAPIDERTFVLVMSHAFLRDKDYLRAALGTRARAISLLGPTTRTQRLLTELRDEGLAIGPDDEARIHGPAGLDLGSEGPEEIAAAIVAEIVAVRRGRAGGFLKERVGPIHDRSLQTGWASAVDAERA
ncbi:MAG: XdhC family protein, partial [Actinomycetota bacterium]